MSPTSVHLSPAISDHLKVMNSTNSIAITNTNAQTTRPDVMSTSLTVLLATVLTMVIMVSVAGNTVLCVLVYRKAAMRSAINLLVAQLALSDVLLSALVMPFALAALFLPVDWRWSRHLCGLEAMLQELLVTLNVCLLLVISVDRYLIIVHRQEKLNVRRARALVLLAWAFSLVSGICPVLGWGSFAMYPGLLQCRPFMAEGLTQLSFVVFSSLFTKYFPLSAIVYCFSRIVTTVRWKNTKVHHCPVGADVMHNRGSIKLTIPRPRISVSGALRDLSPPDQASAIDFTSCPLEYPGQPSAVNSSLRSASPMCYVSSSSALYLHSSPSIFNIHYKRQSSFPTSVPSPLPSSQTPRSTEPEGSIFLDSPRNILSLPVQNSSSVLAASGTVVERALSLSSPSGFSPKARRSAVARRQMLDMSFKTRTFKTILILSVMLLLCLLPYVTAVLMTSVTERQHHRLVCMLLWLLFTKSALNPLVYCVRIPKYRDACRDALPGICGTCADRGCVGVVGAGRVDPSAMYQCAEAPGT